MCQPCKNDKIADLFAWVDTTPSNGGLTAGEIMIEDLKTHKFYNN